MTEANLLLSRFARLQQAARNDLRAAPAPDAAYASYDSRAQRLRALERVLRAYAPERSDDCVREVDQVRDRILRALHEPEAIHAAVRSEDQILALVAAAKAAGFAGVEYNPVMDDEGKPAAWLLLFERA